MLRPFSHSASFTVTHILALLLIALLALGSVRLAAAENVLFTDSGQTLASPDRGFGVVSGDLDSDDLDDFATSHINRSNKVWVNGSEPIVLFYDDFGGNLSRWQVETGTWSIENGELAGQGHGGAIDGWIYAGDMTWTDYSLEADITFVDYNANLVVRSTGHWENEYRISLWEDREGMYYQNKYSILKYQEGVPTLSLTGGNIPSPVPLTSPLHAKVNVQGNEIALWIDGQFVTRIEDSNPLPAGRIGLGVIWDYQNRFDNVVVTSLSSTAIPLAITTSSPLQDGIVDQSYSLALEAVGGSSPYMWAIVDGTLPLGLSLDPSTGVISGIPTAAATWNFTALVADANNETVTKTFTLTTETIAESPTGLTIVTGSSLPNGVIGEPYSVLLEATGGTLPYAWSVVSGSLPPGLALDAATGEISGVPTTAGTYGFTIQVTDSGGQTSSKPFAVAPPPSSGSAGSSYTTPVTIRDPSNDGTETESCSIYEVTSGMLPEGLTLDPMTGIISGTPSTPGSYSFIVQCATTTGQTATKGFTITILASNQPPMAYAGGPYTVAEGDFVTLSASGTDPDGDPLSYAWDLDGDGIFETVAQSPTFSAAGVDGPGSTVATLRVSDGKGLAATSTATIDITNSPPTVTSVTNNGPVDEGDSAIIAVTATDPAGTNDPLGYAFDCNNDDIYEIGPQPEPSVTCAFADNGTFTVNAQVTDDDGGQAFNATVVTVNNVEPIVTAGGTAINENETAKLNGTISDPGINDTFSLEIDWGEGIPETYSFPAGTTSFGLDHQYLDDNPTGTPSDVYAVNVTVTDKDGGSDSTSTDVTVSNLAPSIDAISVPVDPVNIDDQPLAVEVQFSDPGPVDTHDVSVDWGDGNSDIQRSTSSPALSSHTYTSPGVYRVTATVIDDDTGSVTQAYEYIVVYNPDGGFVTGGGWINSPEGACQLTEICKNVTGKASFGFNAKYKKGANVPTGETQFRFKTANLDFHSGSYDWLVVAGAKAQYKGVGTINGSGHYGFMLSASDGAINGGGGIDKFRIKIWDKDNSGMVVYDNQMGAMDDADPTTALGGGSIVIHDPKSKRTALKGTSSGSYNNLLYLPTLSTD